MLNVDFVLNQWIPTLRSGKYEQIYGKLKYLVGIEPKYCCLGVACEILGIPSNRIDSTFWFDGQNEVLPEHAANLIGIPNNQYGTFSVEFSLWAETPYCSLAQMNDKGFSFEEISNILYNAVVFETLWGKPAFA